MGIKRARKSHVSVGPIGTDSGEGPFFASKIIRGLSGYDLEGPEASLMVVLCCLFGCLCCVVVGFAAFNMRLAYWRYTPANPVGGLVTISSLEPSKSTERCQRALVGRHYSVDESGQVCSWRDTDPKSQCCLSSILGGESGSHCDLSKGCCKVYEFCVGQCMLPVNGPVVQDLANKDSGRVGYFGINTLLDFCGAACRTNSRSTTHENAYSSPYHYCYSYVRGDSV